MNCLVGQFLTELIQISSNFPPPPLRSPAKESLPCVRPLPAAQGGCSCVWGPASVGRAGPRRERCRERGSRTAPKNPTTSLLAEALCWIGGCRLPSPDAQQHPQRYRVLPRAPAAASPLPTAHAGPRAHTQAQHSGKRGEEGKYLAERNLQKSLIGPS